MNLVSYYFKHILIFTAALLFTGLNTGNAQNCDVAFSLTGTNDFDIHSMVQSSDGNLLVVGSFKGTRIDFDPGAGTEFRDSPDSKNAFIASYTPSNQLNWVQTIGGEANLKYTDIAVNAAGLIFVCGSASGTSIDLDPGDSDTNHQLPENTTGMAVGCYSRTGTYRWGFIIPAEYNWELQSSISPNKIQLDQKGNIFITGSFQTTYMDLDPGLGVKSYSTTISESQYNDDAFLVKYTQNGNYLWSTAVQSLDTDNGRSVTIDGEGNAYLTGAFSGDHTNFSSGSGSITLSSSGEKDIFISKYDASGNLLWAKKMGGTESEVAQDIKLDSDTNIYIAGNFKGTVDMDTDTENSTITSRGNFDCFFAKYNNNGTLIYAKSFGSDEADQVYQMSINSSSEIYLTGYYKARAANDFDPNEGVKELVTDPTNGNNFLFVSSFTSDGNLNWATSGISTQGIYGSSVLTLKSGTTKLGGHFSGSFGSVTTIGDNLYNIEDTGKTGVFLASVSVYTSIFSVNKIKSKLTVYPNPVSDEIHLLTENYNNQDLLYDASVYNISGIIIYRKNGSLYEIETGLNELIQNIPGGSYYMMLSTDKEILSGSFIKQQ